MRNRTVIRAFRRGFGPAVCMAALVLLASLALACGNDDDAPVATPGPDEVLHLRGFDITAGNFRTVLHTNFIDQDPTICAAIKGFTPAEAIEALDVALGLGVRSGVPLPAATPVTDQKQRDREDELKAARIALDECAGSTVAGTAVASPLRTLTLSEWSERLCTLSAVAAYTLDVAGPENPETLTLEERKQRAADILAPRAASLATTAEAVRALQAPGAAAAFQEVFESTMADVAAGWQDLVDAAARAQSVRELDAANGVWLQVQDEADASVIAAYHELDDQTTAALLQPEDCGILNEIGS